MEGAAMHHSSQALMVNEVFLRLRSVNVCSKHVNDAFQLRCVRLRRNQFNVLLVEVKSEKHDPLCGTNEIAQFIYLSPVLNLFIVGSNTSGQFGQIVAIVFSAELNRRTASLPLKLANHSIW